MILNDTEGDFMIISFNPSRIVSLRTARVPKEGKKHKEFKFVEFLLYF